MKYSVLLSRSARKQLERLSGETERRILAKLTELESNQRPSGCKKLKNRDAWRVRIGNSSACSLFLISLMFAHGEKSCC